MSTHEEILAAMDKVQKAFTSFGDELTGLYTALANFDWEGTVPDPPIDDPSDVLITEVSREVTDSSIAVTFQLIDLDQVVESVHYSRDGQDNTGYGPWSGELDSTVLLAMNTKPYTVTFDKLLPDTTYNIRIEPVLDDDTTPAGSDLKLAIKTKPAPVVTNPPPATGSRAVPLIGASKLPVNNVLFRSGINNNSDLNGWGTRYFPWGRSFDGLMRFVDRDSGWGGWMNDQFLKDMATVAATGKLTIIALPWAPNSEGSSMNQRCADGNYADYHAQMAKKIVQYGLNVENVVLRLNWEWNGTWYAHSIANGGISIFQKAWRATRSAFERAGANRVLWDFCSNKGPQSSIPYKAGDVWFPGMSELLTVDHYNWWPVQNTDANFNAALAQKPGIIEIASLASANGIQWAVDEMGPIVASAGGGGDNASWFANMLATTRKYPGCAWWMLYDDNGNPNTLKHAMDDNPNTKNYYINYIKGNQVS